MSKDELGNKYVEMLSEAKSELKADGVVTPESDKKRTEKAKEKFKNSGPEAAEGTEEAVEAPEELSPVKKGLTKESTNMEKPSFMDLFDQVMSEDVGVEDPSYDEVTGDFPPAAEDEIGGEEGMGEDEPITVTLSSEQVSVLKDIISQVDGDEDLEAGEELEGDLDLAGEEDAMGEAVSEPEPKELNANISQLQAPRKLGDKGVKVTPKKKAALSGDAKKRNGEPEAGPKGFTPADKSMMKVSGTGSAHKAKNASLVEDN